MSVPPGRSGGPSVISGQPGNQPIPMDPVTNAGEKPGWFSRNQGWLIPAAVVGTSAFSAYMNKRENEKARAWNERMSNTEVQRRTQDMLAAGINPMMAAGGGAGSPPTQGADLGELAQMLPKALASALTLQQAKANIGLTQAQAFEATARGVQTGVQTQQILPEGQIHQLNQLRLDVGRLDFRQKTELFQTAIDQARANVASTTSATALTQARAVLEELQRAQAMNEAQFAEWIKTGGPAVTFFGRALSSLRGIIR